MALPEPRHRGYTIEDWKTWDGRWELIHGLAYDMTPAPSTNHQEVSANLHASIWNAIAEAKRKTGGGECKVFAAPTDLYLPNEASVYQPDLLVVCEPAKVAAHGIVGVPDLVVEILSPATASRDLWHKRQCYEAAGVPEYLIVDPDEHKGLLLRLDAGRYAESAQVPWGSVVALLAGKLPVTLG